jgi:beta-1,2-mannosidase
MKSPAAFPTRFTLLLALAFFTIYTIAHAPAAAQSPSQTVPEWQRLSDSPILYPQGTTWESAGTFNPAVILSPTGKIVMLYRAQDSAGTSRIGYAESTDGLHFTRRPQPVLSPEAPYEKDGGAEDPRLQKFGDTYYLTYTAYNKIDAQLCLATSRDLIHWTRHGVIVPANRGNWNVKWTKSGAIAPERIANKYWMYWLGSAADGTDQMGLSSSPDLLHWTEETQTPVLPRRPGQFDSRVVEPGPPPILTPDAIVLIYNAADDHLTYSTAIALFDRHDPRKLLSRSDAPVFAPALPWEKSGQVPNVVFVEGMLPFPPALARSAPAPSAHEFLFYYGAADKYIGVARGTLAPAKTTTPAG